MNRAAKVLLLGMLVAINCKCYSSTGIHSSDSVVIDGVSLSINYSNGLRSLKAGDDECVNENVFYIQLELSNTLEEAVLIYFKDRFGIVVKQAGNVIRRPNGERDAGGDHWPVYALNSGVSIVFEYSVWFQELDESRRQIVFTDITGAVFTFFIEKGDFDVGFLANGPESPDAIDGKKWIGKGSSVFVKVSAE